MHASHAAVPSAGSRRFRRGALCRIHQRRHPQEHGRRETWQAVSASPGTFASTSSEVVVDPQDPGTVYVPRTNLVSAKSKVEQATIRKLFRTSDGGKTWTSTSLPDAASTVHFAVDPTSRNILYLGSGGIYRSRDSGQTWEGPALPNSNVNSLATDRRQAGVLYAALTSQGLYRSADFGVTWKQISGLGNVPANTFISVAVDPRDSSILFGASTNGLFRSTDAGQNWTRLSVSGLFQNVVIDARTHNIYAAGYYTPVAGSLSQQGHVVRSTDGGNTWTVLANGFAQNNPVQVYPDPDSDTALYALQNVPSRDTFPPSQFFASANAGANWATSPINAANDTVESLAVASGSAPAASSVTHVLAAGFRGGALAPDSIATALGTGLANATAAASSSPPPLSLGGAAISILDAKGAKLQAPIFYASPGQINYLVPAGVAPGAAVVTVQREGGAALDQAVLIAATSPGVFTLNAAGLVAAGVLRVTGGQQSSEDVYRVDASGNVVARPIDLGGAGDQVYLLLYGTGFRAAKTEGVSITIGGQPARVSYAGAQGAFAGLDQVNVPIPPSLARSGDVEIKLTAAGLPANAVRLSIQ